MPPIDEALQYRFDTGHKLTELAWEKVGGGTLIAEDTINSLDATKAAMAMHGVIYERRFWRGIIPGAVKWRNQWYVPDNETSKIMALRQW